MASTLTIILALTACGQDAIPTSPRGPEQNALVSVVRVQPSAAVIEPDGTVALSAVVKSARGQTVNGRPVQWTSSDDRVAYVDSQGRIVAGEEGTATIRANVLGVVGEATIDVRGEVVEILIDDPLTSVVEGSQHRLTATLVYENGATRPGRGLRWSSVDPRTLWVDGDGDATGRQAGEVEVYVQGRGKEGSRRVKVGSGNIASVTVISDKTVLAVGDQTTVWADVRNSKGKRVSKDVSWTSSDPSVAIVDASGIVTARSAGTTTVTGTTSGVTGSLAFTVVSGGGGGGGGGGSTAAPAGVVDLAVGQREERRIQLRFTEVGDGGGAPAAYEVRYGLASGFGWNAALPVSKGTCASPLAGTQVGAQRTCWVDGLVAEEDYSFQIVAYRPADEAYGPLSNVLTASTLQAAIVIDVTPSAFQLETSDTRQVSARITDSYGNEMAGTPTWTTSRSSVATLSSSGASATVTGEAPGEAAIRATFGGSTGGSAVTVTSPISEAEGGESGSGGSGTGGSTGGTGAPPPPPSGQHFTGDFSAAGSDSELQSMVAVQTTGNVHADPGVGMRYDFQAFPNRCGDQSLSSAVPLPSGTKEVWVRFKIRFSSNWTTVNPNCSSPAPDYKTVLTWLDQPPSGGGGQRFDFKAGHGGSALHASAPGYPQKDIVPLNVVQLHNGASNYLFDGQWHTVELHQALIGDNRAVVQVRVDGFVTHNYETVTATGLTPRWLTRINIGANRNLGATSLMHVWWDDFEVWVGSTDPGFGFPAPTQY